MSLSLPASIPRDELPANNPPMRLSFCLPRRVVHGGMSLVYLCEVTAEGAWGADRKVVAVKRLAAEVLAVPGAAERFLRECYLWLQISRHPNVVLAVSAHQAHLEAPLLVLEYVPGSLRQILNSGPVPPTRGLQMLIGIADGLAHTRQELPGFVHADLKPENVLVSADGLAKITDLGLSRSVSGAALEQTVGPLTATATGSGGGGTPLYMAPEQILEGRAVPESDIYALGCIAYEVLAGTPAYGAPVSPADYLLRHLYGQPVPLEGVDQQLVTLLPSMLAKAPADRPSLPHVLTVLRTIADGLGAPVPVPAAAGPDWDRRLDAARGLANIRLFPEALEVAEHLVAGVNGDVAVQGRLVMANAYTKLGRPELADEQLDLVAAAFDSDTPLSDWHAYYTERMGAAGARDDPDAEERYARAAIEALPTSSNGYANAAWFYRRMGRRTEAIEALFQALEFSTNFIYFNVLVSLLVEENRWAEALDLCNSAVRCHPTISQAYVTRAMTRLLFTERTGQVMPLLRNLLLVDLALAQRFGRLDPDLVAMWRGVIAALSSGENET